jgi:hypothetical protein
MALSRSDLNQRVTPNLQARLGGQTEVREGRVRQGSGGVPLASRLGTPGPEGVGGSGRVEVGERPSQLMTAAELKAQAGKPTWLNSLPFREPSLYKQILTSLQGYEQAGGTAGQKLARLDELEQQVADWKAGNAGRGHRKDEAKLRELTALEGQIAQERQALQGERQVELRDTRQARGEEVLREVSDAVPRGLDLVCRDSDGAFVGDLQGSYPQETLERTLEHFDKLLAKAVPTAPSPRPDGSGDRPVVANQFEADFERQDNWIRTPQGKVLLRDGEKGSARDALHGFTGSANQTLHLSKFLSQSAFNALHNGVSTLLGNELGDPINLGFARRSSEDGRKPAQVTVSRDPQGDYIVDYAYQGSLKAFTGAGMFLNADPKSSPVELGLRIKVRAEDLERGDLRYEVLTPPSFNIHFELDESKSTTG